VDYVVSWQDINVSEDLAASIFRVMKTEAARFSKS
jgi:hypothetical protein